MSLIDFGDIAAQNAVETRDNQAMMDFASYRAAGTNVTSEPERNGPAEVSETRKLDGTQ